MKNLKKITSFDKRRLKRLLAPVWECYTMDNETGVIVGEEGKVALLGTPIADSVEVKNIFWDVLFEEGVDYTLEGSCIKRKAGGSLPYFTLDEYFRKEPNAHIILKADAEKIGLAVEEQRYVYFSEGIDGFDKYITVSYKKSAPLCEGLIAGDSALQSFVADLQKNKSAKIKFYGDSITVGCNATGTRYGGNVSPYLPDWITLVKFYLEEEFGAEITVENHAVGGWRSVEGVEKFEEKCREGLEKTDLFCIGFGANDLFTSPEEFGKNITAMLDEYFKANPNGSALLYSTLLPNSQVDGWRVNQPLFEEVLLRIKSAYEKVGVAKVSSVFSALEKAGKPTRDWLANSINHPNDFGVRIYAQTILKTLLGDKFY